MATVKVRSQRHTDNLGYIFATENWDRDLFALCLHQPHMFFSGSHAMGRLPNHMGPVVVGMGRPKKGMGRGETGMGMLRCDMGKGEKTMGEGESLWIMSNLVGYGPPRH